MAATKKTATKKPVAKKVAVKKVVAKKTVAAKVVAKKPVAKKTVAKKPVAKKTVTKKPVAKKPVAKKPVAKKPVPPAAASWDQPEQPLDPAAMDGRGERAPSKADTSATTLDTSVKPLTLAGTEDGGASLATKA